MKRFPLVWSLAFAASTALAHHGNSEYDLSNVLRYEGTLQDIQWKNPHILVKLQTQTAGGEAITLEIEGASPSVLRTGGFTAASLVKGERVTAVVSPSKRSPKDAAYGYEIDKADGSKVPLVSARMVPQLTSQAASSLFGTWVPTADSFARFTRALNGWALTDKGRDIKSKYTVAASGQAKCIPVSAPMLMMYPVVTVFERGSDRLTIRTEWLGAERTVWTDGRAHPPATQRFAQGHSVGRFEGDVLVVDTTNFSDQETGGVPSGAQRHLVERFTLGKDGKSLAYSFTLQDPEYLAAEITGTADMGYRPDLQLTGVECDQELAKHFIRQ